MTAIRWDLSALFREIRPDKRNKAALARLMTTGAIGHAMEGPSGRMHVTIRARPGESAWNPAVVVLPHGGDLDVDFYNDDVEAHSALMPSNGASMWVWLPVRSHGRVRLNLDGPGYYWYGSTVGRDDDGGLVGAIVVLDRPVITRT